MGQREQQREGGFPGGFDEGGGIEISLGVVHRQHEGRFALPRQQVTDDQSATAMVTLGIDL